MSTIVIGDVHGNSSALADLLDKLLPELRPDDCIVFLGDYVDRGPDSKGCIGQIIEFRDAAPGTVIALMGNHENWLLRSYRDYTRHSWVPGMEAFDTIRSYSRQAEILLRAELARAGPQLVMDRVRIPYGIFFDHVPGRPPSLLREPEALLADAGGCLCAWGDRSLWW